MAHRLRGPIERDERDFGVRRDRVHDIRRHFDRMRAQVLKSLTDVNAVAVQQ